MRAEYVIIDPKTGMQIGPPVCNSLIQEGHIQLMSSLFNKDDITDYEFIFGAFAEVPVYTTTKLAQYASEPTIAVNGYARQTVVPTGWTIVSQNTEVYAESPDITFTAVGGSFDKAFNRFFMHLNVEDPALTFTEYLTSISSAIPAAITLTVGLSYVFRYRVFLK